MINLMSENNRKIRFHYLQLIWLLYSLINVSDGRSSDRMTRIRCQAPESIPNGSYRLRKNNSLMRINCRTGFVLQGPIVVDCVNGKWYGEKPVCAKRGCHVTVPNPEHGLIQLDNDFRMVLFCMDNYKLAGNRYVYCNGTDWDREIGNCREPTYDVEHECDFETDDYCGWAWEETIGTEWKRVMASNIYISYRTGPRHDHTTMSSNGGHYMLMETVIPDAQPALLMSPVYERELSLKTACCFQFYYFMYGSGVGDLMVYVRPISITIKDILTKDEYLRFHLSGNQNNLWNEAHFKIGELNENFQIIFVATAGRNHLSDIAIDDVKLLTGEDCRALDQPSDVDGDSGSEEVTDEVLIDTQSCRGRCLEATGAGFVKKYGQLYGRCNCHIECEEDESCCPDYRIICLSVIFEQTTQADENSIQNITIDSTNPETTKVNVIIGPTTRASTSTSTTLSTTLSTTTPKTTRTTTSITRKTTATTTVKSTPSTTSTKKTTLSTTTTRKTTPSTTTTRKPTTPKITTKVTTKSTTKPQTTSTESPKSKFIWKTTTKTSTATTTTTTTMKPTTIKKTTQKSTTTTKATPKTTTPQTIPLEKPTKDKRPKTGKQEILTWDVDLSSKELKSPANKILLIALILLVITILVSTAYYHYKEDMISWYAHLIRSENGAFGDVETTSIRAKFRAKANSLITNTTIMGRASRLGHASGHDNEDINCLIDTDNDFDNEFSIENPTAMGEAKASKSGSLSTNL